MTGVCAHTLHFCHTAPEDSTLVTSLLGSQNSGTSKLEVLESEDLLQQSPWCGNIPVLLPDVIRRWLNTAALSCQRVGKCQSLDPSLSTHWCAAFSFLVLGLVPGLKIKSKSGFICMEIFPLGPAHSVCL